MMRNPDRETVFRFKQFEVINHRSAMKVGTDGVLIGAWSFEDVDPLDQLKILDIGVGTGLISLMMAQRFPKATIYGIDIDLPAIEETAENFSNSQWPERLNVLQADFNSFRPSICFDLIVSNPPFFTESLRSSDQQRMQARHQDTLSLDVIISRSAELLSPNGRIALIAPADKYKQIDFAAAIAGLSVVRVAEVRTVVRRPSRRVMVELSRNNTEKLKRESILIRNEDGTSGDRYKSLVEPFYLHF